MSGSSHKHTLVHSVTKVGNMHKERQYARKQTASFRGLRPQSSDLMNESSPRFADQYQNPSLNQVSEEKEEQ